MKNELYNTTGPQTHAPTTKASKTIPVLAVVSFLAGLQCATQFFAHEFQYQSALGAHMRQLFAPWSILSCAGRWYAAYTNLNMHAGSFGFSVTALVLIALVIARTVLADSARRNPSLHRSARFANLKYIQQSELVPLAHGIESQPPRSLWENSDGKNAALISHMNQE